MGEGWNRFVLATRTEIAAASPVAMLGGAAGMALAVAASATLDTQQSKQQLRLLLFFTDILSGPAVQDQTSDGSDRAIGDSRGRQPRGPCWLLLLRPDPRARRHSCKQLQPAASSSTAAVHTSMYASSQSVGS
jgi:hypothetical protein